MVILKSIKYVEWEGEHQEWKLEGISLFKINLIVGRNASGKTRTLNVIYNLSRYLMGNKPLPLSGYYDAEFLWDDKIIRYELKCQALEVIEERFSLNGEVLLERSKGGEGEIMAEAIENGQKVRFQTPPSELAAVARRDSIQHTFLEPLFSWASSLRHYAFGTALGKNRFEFSSDREQSRDFERDQNRVVALYLQAERELGPTFKEKLIADMKSMEYELLALGVSAPISVRVEGAPAEVIGLFAREKDLTGITDQHSMSQGMFRALSLLIQINYVQVTGRSTCILVDDIGEGLDFERSCRLITLLRQKAKESNIQLILSTNDRYVMNNVPLEEWSVLQRNGNTVRVINHKNAGALFEEFKFTGLSNFSFFELDIVNGVSAKEFSSGMRRIAVFVEGHTEIEFVEKLIEEIAGHNNLCIDIMEIRGGSRAPRTMNPIKSGKQEDQSHYVLLFDCGSDTQVKTQIVEEHRNLTNKGYSRIIGLRDVRPTFSYQDIPRLEAALSSYIDLSLVPVSFILTIMEIEAWFLAESSHFSKIDPTLTPEVICDRLGFDPAKDDMALREFPSNDLKNCYAIVGNKYSKHDVDATIAVLDFSQICLNLRYRIPYLDRLIHHIEAFITG